MITALVAALPLTAVVPVVALRAAPCVLRLVRGIVPAVVLVLVLALVFVLALAVALALALAVAVALVVV